ncbi:hypothetical protein L8O48_17600 [Enterobacter cloacae]|uniref:hypothetical protein n=1 Tax=Enterobacter cloacae TaxID=550 RepID=UPI002002C123|nr:hypothetical protein [Enterobacter cloacae]MCK7268879.1 hypothetical protein [Enterobacter cloacae]
MLKKITILILLSTLFSASSFSFPWPVVTSGELTNFSHTNNSFSGRFQFFVGYVDVPDIYADEIATRNGYSVGVTVSSGSEQFGWYSTGNNLLGPSVALCRPGPCAVTWKEASDIYIKQFGMGIRDFDSAFTLTTSPQTYNGQVLRTCSGINDGRNIINPPGISGCNGYSPSGYTYCNFIDENVDFNFGRMVASQASGSHLSKDINIECVKGPAATAKLTYTLQLVQGNPLPLSNGMFAMFTIDGKELSEIKHPLSTEVYSLPLTATLTGAPTTTGPFEGNAVMIFSIM